MIRLSTITQADREGDEASHTAAAASPPLPGGAGQRTGSEPAQRQPAAHLQADVAASGSRRIIPVGAEFEHADGGPVAGGEELPNGGAEELRRPLRDDRGARTRKASDKIQPVRAALQLHREFVMHAMADLSRAPIAVWMTLFNASRFGRVEIGYRRIADVAGLAMRHVGEAIQELEKYGLVVVDRRGRYQAGNSITSAYRIYGKPTQPIERKRRRGKPSTAEEQSDSAEGGE